MYIYIKMIYLYMIISRVIHKPRFSNKDQHMRVLSPHLLLLFFSSPGQAFCSQALQTHSYPRATALGIHRSEVLLQSSPFPLGSPETLPIYFITRVTNSHLHLFTPHHALCSFNVSFFSLVLSLVSSNIISWIEICFFSVLSSRI